jgi:eukaryotic-like serine/threonine-protein kinase
VAVVGATAVIVGLGIGGWLLLPRKTHALTDKDTIVVADFTNTTGDPVFDGTLRQGLSVQLEQSPFLSIISDLQIQRTLRLMGQQPDARLTPEVAREVCQRTASAAALDGSIALIGTQYLLTLKASNCATGQLLVNAAAQASDKDHVLKALGQLGSETRGRLGESLISVKKYDTPIDDATTPSLEALKAYSLGRKMAFANGDEAALPFFRRAIELDPNFAMAYASLSTLYTNLNQEGRSLENSRKAYELRQNVSERERFYIETNYYAVVTGELEKAAKVYYVWQQTYPRDATPYGNLSFISCLLGNWETGLKESREALALKPDSELAYGNVAISYIALNRLRDAEDILKQAESHGFDSPGMLTIRYALAFLKNDSALMGGLARSAVDKSGVEDLLLAAEADTAAWHGKLNLARDFTRRAMDSAERNDAKETAATYQALSALREGESGRHGVARIEANAAMKLGADRDVKAMAALALARAGDTAGSEKLASQLDKRFPLSTVVQTYWLPVIRAAVALQRNNANQAIELLRVSSPIELGQPTGATGFLFPAYLRGEAYLALRDGEKAIAEFQKFVDHPGVVVNFQCGALAYLQLGRAYAMQGDTTKAKTAYQDFLTLWKDADPDISLLKQTKAEYANL